MTYLRGSNRHGLFVGRKPEQVGNEGITANDSEMNILMFIDWAQGRVVMKTKKYHNKYMHMIVTSMCLSESWHGSSQLFGGDSWFAGVKNALVHRKHGLHFIGDVKGSTAFYPKQLLMDWTPSMHGEYIIYKAKIVDEVLYAIGVQRGFMTVRHLITTCCTTLPAEEQMYVD